jgi:NAD(P)H-dependent FMN reductase
MKILAFAGSSSSTSINRELVKFVLRSFPDDEINLLDLNDFEMPVFSIDKEKKGFPEEAHQFLAEIKTCDIIICSMAEHNRNFTTAFKNIFDWCSRIDVQVFQNKKMFLMSTSPGGFGGGNALALAQKNFPAYGAEIIESYSLPKFYDNFDLEKGVVNPTSLKELNDKITHFKQQIS